MRRLLIVAALVGLDAAGYVGLNLSHARKAEAPAAAGKADRAAAPAAAVALYPPQGLKGGAARGFVIYFSDAAGWTGDADGTARAIAAEGFAVAGVDSRAFLAALEETGEACVHPVQPLASLAARAQAGLGWTAYRRPILAGHGLGGTLAYAALTQAVPGIFTAGVSTAFADVLPGSKRWCSLNGYTAARVAQPVPGWRPGPAAGLTTPWRVLDLAGAPAADPVVAAILAGSPAARALAAPSEAAGLAAALAALPATPPRVQSSSQ